MNANGPLGLGNVTRIPIGSPDIVIGDVEIRGVIVRVRILHANPLTPRNVVMKIETEIPLSTIGVATKVGAVLYSRAYVVGVTRSEGVGQQRCGRYVQVEGSTTNMSTSKNAWVGGKERQRTWWLYRLGSR